jgi:hypothetical protein
VKHDAAVRISERERKTVVLHVGDFDPSGLSLFDSLAEDVSEFVDGLIGPTPTFERVAVTPAQVEEFDLPAAPAKKTDRRSVWREGDQTVQAEALAPNVLASEVRQAVEQWLDQEVVEALIEVERQERQELLTAVDGFGSSA